MLPPLKTNNPELLENNTYPIIERDSVSTKSVKTVSPRSFANALAASTKDPETSEESSSDDEDDEEWNMGFV